MISTNEVVAQAIAQCIFFRFNVCHILCIRSPFFLDSKDSPIFKFQKRAENIFAAMYSSTLIFRIEHVIIYSQGIIFLTFSNDFLIAVKVFNFKYFLIVNDKQFHRTPWFSFSNQRPLVRKPTIYETCHKAIKFLIISKTINIESSAIIYKWGL